MVYEVEQGPHVGEQALLRRTGPISCPRKTAHGAARAQGAPPWRTGLLAVAPSGAVKETHATIIPWHARPFSGARFGLTPSAAAVGCWSEGVRQGERSGAVKGSPNKQALPPPGRTWPGRDALVPTPGCVSCGSRAADRSYRETM